MLTQIPFNGTNFINVRLTQRVFSVWTLAQPVVGEKEMHSVANVATLQTPLATFFPSKKASKPYLDSKNLWYCRARSCFPSTCTHLSLSPRLLSFCSACAHTHTPLSIHICSVSVQRVHTHTHLSLSTSAQFLFSVCTHTHTSLYPHLLSFCSACDREEQSLIQLKTDISCLLL